MKKILMMMMAVSSLMLTACLDDEEGYSLGKVWISLGEVESQGSGSALVRLDDGALLFPVAGEGPLSLPEEGTRILVNYTIVGDKLINETTKEYYIRLNSWRRF